MKAMGGGAKNEKEEEEEEQEEEEEDQDVPEEGGEEETEERVWWAATQIQRLWRRRRHWRLPEGRQPGAPDRARTCCGCFASVVVPVADSDDGLFCASCASLPRLSVLRRTQAKYHEQLAHLRLQQALLQQQQREMELRKRSQEETLALERELARQRRRHIRALLERRRRVQQQQQQQQHQDAVAELPHPSTRQRLNRRRSESAPATTNSVAVSYPRRRLPLADAPPSAGERITAEAQVASKLDNQQRKRRQVASCYAQDLAPLVDGNKPRKLLPPAVDPGLHRRSPQPATMIRRKPPPPAHRRATKIQLEPLPRSVNNNADEDEDGHLCVAVGGRRVSASMSALTSTPLTAEIRPVLWVYELGKDVLGLADPLPTAKAGPSPSFRSPSLMAVREEEADTNDDGDVSEQRGRGPTRANHHPRTQDNDGDDGDDDDEPPAPPSMAVSVVPRTSSSSTKSSRSPPPPAAAAAMSPPWEYSSARLASLLAKYNVSVSRTAAGGSSSSHNLLGAATTGSGSSP